MASTSATPSIKREAAIELSHYSRSEFFAAAEKNFGFLRSYFAETRGVSPRLCIKGNFLKDGRSHVISIFRDSQVAYDSGYDVHENSGFDHCLRTGQYFLDNDLPASSMKGRYRNPRIDQEVVREIAASVLMSKHETVSSNWSSAWKSGENDSASAYRSTLIVPITLLNNDLSAEFREKYNADDADRLVFGFLCMDSPSEGFFEKPDVDVGYVIADFLALFSYAMFNYTDYSNTFNRAKETMDEIPEELMMASSRNFNIGDFDSVVEPTRRKKSDKNAMVYFTSPAAIDSEVE